MKKRSFKYKKALGITFALAVFLGGIGVVQRILDNHTSDFEDESVVKVEENKDNKDKKEENSGNPYMEEGKGRVLRDILWKEEKNT